MTPGGPDDHPRALPFLAVAAIALALPATSAAQQPSGLLEMDTYMVIPDECHGSRAVSHRIMTQLYRKAWFDKFRAKPVA